MTGPAASFSPGLRRAIGVVMIGASLSLLDSTIVNVALHGLSVDLHASLAAVQWVVTAYLLALAAIIPATGWAAGRFGAARVYAAALGMFTVGSALCACSPNLETLIVSRVIQGVGGGAIMPVGTIIWTAHSSRAQFGRVMSLIAVPMVLAPTLGPAIGGLLMQSFGWRSIFWLNVPIGLITIILALRLLPGAGRHVAGTLNAAGLILAATGTAGITYGLSEFGAAAGTDIYALAAILIGFVALAGFVVHALKSPRPLLDLRLYANRSFTAAAITLFVLGAAMYGGMILMPLYFQIVRGEDVILTGLLVAPTGLGALLAAPLAARYGAGVTTLVGAAIQVASTIPFVFLAADTSYTLLCLAMVVRGAGFSLSFVPATTAAYRALTAEQIAHATPQLNVIQRVGGAMGTAVLALVLNGELGRHHTLSGRADGFGTAFLWVLAITAAATIPAVVLAQTERRAIGHALNASVFDPLVVEDRPIT